MAPVADKVRVAAPFELRELAVSETLSRCWVVCLGVTAIVTVLKVDPELLEHVIEYTVVF